jgi:tetratricopeptide (TPR) repeat protein
LISNGIGVAPDPQSATSTDSREVARQGSDASRDSKREEMSKMKAWIARPVFVSSTFRDMQAERDYLRDVVFPELAERLRTRRHHLDPIDLRWGIETASVADEGEKEAIVLKVCLDEIERSRPYMIVLLGERYGWVPSGGRMMREVRARGIDVPVQGMSVTHLEIEFGAFSGRDQARRTFFYFRDPLPTGEMPPEVRCQYCDDEADAAAADLPAPALPRAVKAARTVPVEEFARLPSCTKLGVLKRAVESLLGTDRVRTYRASWDARTRRVVGLEGFGRMVLDDLWTALASETAPSVQVQERTQEEEERDLQEEFVEERSRWFAGRGHFIERLRRRALDETDSRGIVCLEGEPGSGKSTIFARLVRELEQEDCVLLAQAAGVTRQSGSVDALLDRWCQDLARALHVPLSGSEPSTTEERRVLLSELLDAAKPTRVVLLLDALDEMERCAMARHVTWLPDRLPEHVCMIVTAAPGEETAALGRRPDVRMMSLPRLMPDEVQGTLDLFGHRYRKKVPPEVAEALTALRGPDGQPACGNPLWLNAALQELLLLDEDDFSRVEGEGAGTAEQRLNAMILDVARDLDTTVEGILRQVAYRAAKRFGEAVVTALLDLLATSRHGLRESDLRHLVPECTGRPWDDLVFASLRRYLRAHLATRGRAGLWEFRHQQFRHSLRSGRLSSEAARAAYHRRIADHIEGLPADDPLRHSELLHHYLEAAEYRRAARYAGGQLSDMESAACVDELSRAVTESDGSTGSRAMSHLVHLLEGGGAPEDALASLGVCWLVACDLVPSLEKRSTVECRLKVVDACSKALSRLPAELESERRDARMLCDLRAGGLLAEAGRPDEAMECFARSAGPGRALLRREPDNARLSRVLAASLVAAGDLCRELGDLPSAQTYFAESLEIRQDELRRRPSADVRRGMPVVLERLAYVCSQCGDFDKASDHLQTALRIHEETFRNAPDLLEPARGVANTTEKLGTLLRKQGKLSEALALYRSSLAECEKLYRRRPDDAVVVRDLATILQKLGDLLLQVRNPAEAARCSERSFGLIERLCALSPDSAHAQDDLAASCQRLGDIALAMGDVPRSREWYERMHEVCESLSSSHPESPQYLRTLGIAWEKLGDVAMRSNDPRRAYELQNRCREVRERLQMEHMSDLVAANELAIIYDRLSDSALQMRRVDEAIRWNQECIRIAEQVQRGAPGNEKYCKDLAVAYYKLGCLLDQIGDSFRTFSNMRLCASVLEDMERKGMQLDDQARGVLAQLRGFLASVSRDDFELRDR